MNRPYHRRTMERILVVEDDAALSLAMTKALRAAGYDVTTARNGAQGLALALADPPDCVLLDVMLPERNGYEILEELRAHDADLPIVMITAKAEEADKVRGLELGADEYVVKPVGLRELQARVNAALRRRRQVTRSGPVAVGALVVDFATHTASRAGAAVELTALEGKLLAFFLRNEGRLLSRAHILASVWGADYEGTERTVDNFVNRLRAKLEPEPATPMHLVTVRGGGYRFQRT